MRQEHVVEFKERRCLSGLNLFPSYGSNYCISCCTSTALEIHGI